MSEGPVGRQVRIEHRGEWRGCSYPKAPDTAFDLWACVLPSLEKQARLGRGSWV
jgi:hypothetical protein